MTGFECVAKGSTCCACTGSEGSRVFSGSVSLKAVKFRPALPWANMLRCDHNKCDTASRHRAWPFFSALHNSTVVIVLSESKSPHYNLHYKDARQDHQFVDDKQQTLRLRGQSIQNTEKHIRRNLLSPFRARICSTTCLVNHHQEPTMAPRLWYNQFYTHTHTHTHTHTLFL